MPVFKKKQRALKPAHILVFGFACVIAVGTVLLILPFSTRPGISNSLSDALFVSTSATCVNGITLFDTYTHYTMFGHIVIMVLMQIGGIGMLTLVTFFNMIIGRKMGLLRANDIMLEHTTEGLSASRRVFGRVIGYSFAIETFGALLMSFVFVPRYGAYGVFMAFFMAVSAFCNSGFDLFGMENTVDTYAIYSDNPLLLGAIALMVFMGGLGYVVWRDVIEYRRNKKLLMHTRIVLTASAVLIAVGAVVYFIIMTLQPEYGDLSLREKAYSSVFTSVAARTSGMTGLKVATCSDFSEMFTMLLMFIGAAPASTAGGIKLTTFAIIIATVWSVVKGKDETVLMGYRIKKEVVYKSLTVLSLSLAFLLVAFTLIFFTNDNLRAIDLLFETTSAFTTTGFSNGTALAINGFGRGVLACTMFIGRMGPVSLILSLSLGKREEVAGNKVLPESTIMVG